MHAVAYCAPLAYRPGHEAISKEISLLLEEGGEGFVVMVPPFKSPPWRALGPEGRTVHPARLLSGFTARRSVRGADLLHVFTPLPLPRRLAVLIRNGGLPVLVTVISCGEVSSADVAVLNRARGVVAECRRDLERLLSAGVDATKVHLILPASDLIAGDLPVPPEPFTILFGSSPLQPDELEQRGVDLLVEAARRLSGIRFHLLWRPGAEQSLARLPALPNLILDRTLYADIREVLSAVHAVVVPFRPGGKAKSAPLSVIEALQCGRPVLVSSAVGMADLIAEKACGVVFDPEADALVDAVGKLRRDYHSCRVAAVDCRDLFDAQSFRRSYADLVDKLFNQRRAG